MLLLAVPGTAQAAIVFSDTSNLATPWFNASNNGGDAAVYGKQRFHGHCRTGQQRPRRALRRIRQNNSGADATPTIKWVTSAGTQTLQLGVTQVSASGSYVYAQVYYLYNPNVGTGAITLSASGREYSMNAYTLSGVNTGAAPALTRRLRPPPRPPR